MVFEIMRTIFFFTTGYGRSYFSDGTSTPTGYQTRIYASALKRSGHAVRRLLLEDVEDMELIREFFRYPVDITAEDLNNKTL